MSIVLTHPNKNQRFFLRTPSLFASLLIAGLAHASETTTLDPIVVTALRQPQTASQTFWQTTQISNQDISQSGAGDLPTLLQQMGGLELVNNGGNGHTTSIFMRGANAQHTLVLVDGLRIGSLTAGTTALQHLALASIDHIEITQGTLSSLYGSDAIGGVIQIFTKQGKGKVSPTLQMGIGSDKLFSASASIGGGDNIHWMINASHQQSKGFSATNPDAAFSYQDDQDGYRQQHIGAQISSAVTEQLELGLNLQHTNTRADIDNPFSSNPNPAAKEQLNIVAFTAKQAWSATQFSSAQLAQTEDNYTLVNEDGRFRTQQTQLQLQHRASWNTQTLNIGMDILRERLHSDTVYDATARNTQAVFANYHGSIGAHSWLLAARQDNGASHATTGSVAYRFAFSPAWQASTTYATGFKLANFNDLYYPGYSNPNLNPERSRNLEFALQYQTDTQSTRLTAFNNRIRDLIAFDFVTFTPQNVNTARLRGISLNSTGQSGVWQWQADATVQSTRDTTSNTRLLRRAARFASASLNYAPNHWSVGAEWRITGNRMDSGNQMLAGYAVFNLHAQWQFAPAWQLQARIDNAFDRQYTPLYGYNSAGRGLSLQLKFTP